MASATSVRVSVVGEDVRPETDQGLTDGDAELGGHHARGLVDDQVEVGTDVELGGHRIGGRVALHGQDRYGRPRRP